MGIETLKQEDVNQINENELDFFCDSLTSAKKCQYTLDYFDTSIGILYSQENPTSLKFCVALLKEILCNLKPSHELWDKIKYAAFLLNLATRNVEFNVLYEIYHQVEIDIELNNLSWKDFEVKNAFDKRITEKFIVKDDVCSLSDFDQRKTDQEFTISEPENLNGDVHDDVDEDTNLSTPAIDNEDYNTNNVVKENDQKIETEDEPVIKTEESRKKRKSPVKRKPKLSEKKKSNELNIRKRRKKNDKKENEEEENGLEEDILEAAKFPCLQCKFKARKQQDLDKHAFEKHEANRLCSQCGHLSNTYKDFVSHNETHMFTCEICQKKILGVRTLRAHMKKHELKEEDGAESSKVPCDICGVLLQAISLKQHVALVHSVEIHTCDLCGYTTNCKAKLNDHRNRHFPKLSNCPECGKMVKNIKRHFRRTCSGKKEERFFCHLCEKSFTFKHGLNRHIKHIHQKITNHHCELCDYKTYTKFNLKVHISKMHTKEEMEKICPFCSQKTNSLEYHIRIYHYDDQAKSLAFAEENHQQSLNNIQ